MDNGSQGSHLARIHVQISSGWIKESEWHWGTAVSNRVSIQSQSPFRLGILADIKLLTFFHV